MRATQALAESPTGKSFKLWGYAFLISFTGTLPVGTLNISVTDLVINKGAWLAFLFGMGAILVEVSMVRIALVAVRRLEGMTSFLWWGRILACCVILLLAFFSLQAAWQMKKAAAVLPFADDNPFVSGVVLSLLNPLHLPFWMGWTTVLKSKGLLSDKKSDYNRYVLAIGLGTGAAFLVYGVAGHFLILFLRTNQNLFNWLAGIALLIAGLVQVWKLAVI